MILKLGEKKGFEWSKTKIPFYQKKKKNRSFEFLKLHFLNPYPLTDVIAHPGPSPTLLHPENVLFKDWTRADKGIEFGWKPFYYQREKELEIFWLGESRFPPRTIEKEILFDQTLLSLFKIYSQLPLTLKIDPRLFKKAELGVSTTIFWNNTIFPFWTREKEFFHYTLPRPNLYSEDLLFPLRPEEMEKAIKEIEEKPILPFYTFESNKSLATLWIRIPLS